MKAYELHLPVFKQGDDLAHCISQHPNDLKAAFEQQASHYDEAARICRRMAGVAAEVPDLEIDAGTHHIGVCGPPERLETLVTEELLIAEEYDDDDVDGEDDDGDLDGGDDADDDAMDDVVEDLDDDGLIPGTDR